MSLEEKYVDEEYTTRNMFELSVASVANSTTNSMDKLVKLRDEELSVNKYDATVTDINEREIYHTTTGDDMKHITDSNMYKSGPEEFASLITSNFIEENANKEELKLPATVGGNKTNRDPRLDIGNNQTANTIDDELVSADTKNLTGSIEGTTIEEYPKNTTENQETNSPSNSGQNFTSTEDKETTSKNVTNMEHIVTTMSTPTTRKVLKEDAIKDIAYYLRAHKFNEYDRRYETNGDTAPSVLCISGFWSIIGKGQCQGTSWSFLVLHCDHSTGKSGNTVNRIFFGCVEYLNKRLRYTALKRVDDTAVVMKEQKWTLQNNSEQIQQVEAECKKMRRIGDTIADPFEGPLERFQWRTTASYYMCWYTMQQTPELEHLSEMCDNFANCLDEGLGPNNGDTRADDSRPFACALYSFCPDPCCPDRRLVDKEACWNSLENPCFEGNPVGQRECAVNRSLNIDFRDIVLNRWNVTCGCPKTGYVWNSMYGMCVDVDECATDADDCDQKLEACVNLEGSFRCACKWGHIWNSKKKACTPSAALKLIKLGRRQEGSDKDGKGSFFKRIANFFRKSNSSSMLQCNYTAILFTALCTWSCIN
ncbi:hypothetical protein NQ318_015700 [Aromia moschata]|uniref:EGF-like calcium-binding domain-containing protein n=1 Tax=Aromia moschata TaxID=1265417 RepID=A0AAV8YIX5_9CUCU|nr:hypothetical protein NQ318_015700 [Aromia moschata]